MIQRIQSFWLLMSTGLMVSFLYLPLATFSTLDGTFDSFLFRTTTLEGLELLNSPLALIGIFCLFTASFTFLGIFLFKKRTFQMRLTRFAITLKFMIICGLGAAFYLVTKDDKAEVSIKLGIIVPIIAFIFDFMAFKAIKSDDDLVKSIDRIR